ncbi:MAG TPA: substrate-binding domain-containing protein [Polyangiaceae bacterium]
MSSGTPRIAVLLDHIESDYHVEVLTGALRAVRASRARALVVPGGWLSRSDADPIARNFVYDFLSRARIDGVLALAGSLSNYAGLTRLRTWLERFDHVPVVTLGIDVPDVPSVWVDNAVGVEALVDHLITVHEKRRIAFIRGPNASPEAEARRLAYLRALERHGIALDDRLVVSGGFNREDGVAAASELFDARRFTPATLDAVVAVNDEAALGALEELTRRGIAVPQAIAVGGFDDAPGAATANPPLTTVSQRVELQGFTAARALLDAVGGKRRAVGAPLDPELVVRTSCGCVVGFQNDSAKVRAASPGLARTAALFLVERRPTIAAELARAAAGRLVGMSGWETRLVDALAHDLGGAAESAFVYEVEQFARKNVALGRSVMVCHDVLTVLRLQTLVAASVEPSSRARIEDLFQEARLRLARVGSDVEHELQQNLNAHLRVVTKACLGVIAGGDARSLETTLCEHLPALGISAYCVSRLRAAKSRTELAIVARFAPNALSSASHALATNELGIDPTIEREETLVLEPLEFGGTPVGIAAFAWGAKNPVHYESLRELLAAAVHALAARG